MICHAKMIAKIIRNRDESTSQSSQKQNLSNQQTINQTTTAT